MTVTLVQDVSGAGATGITTPTAGNLLVVSQGHRSEPATPTSPGSGFVLQAVKQFGPESAVRHGVAVWSKVSDGTETSVDLNFGSGSDLGGFFLELTSSYGLGFLDASILTSAVSPVTVGVVPSKLVDSVAIAATTFRDADPVTDWDSGFTSPAATRNQMGIAWRTDASTIPDDDVTFTHDGNQGSVAVVTFESTATWTVSGTVTDDGVAVEGADVLAVQTASGFGNPSVVAGKTDVSGNYSFDVPVSRIAHVFAARDDAGTLYTAEGRPFIEEPGP